MVTDEEVEPTSSQRTKTVAANQNTRFGVALANAGDTSASTHFRICTHSVRIVPGYIQSWRIYRVVELIQPVFVLKDAGKYSLIKPEE